MSVVVVVVVCENLALKGGKHPTGSGYHLREMQLKLGTDLRSIREHPILREGPTSSLMESPKVKSLPELHVTSAYM